MRGAADTIRVLLVDDHVAIRQGLAFLLGQHERISIVGQAGTGQEARNLVLRLQPDLVLLDLILPDTSPSELCPELRQLYPRVRVLILSGSEDAARVYEAIDAGIDGYALKNVDSAELITAIEQVMLGNSYLHPTITRLVLHRTALAHRSVSTSDAPNPSAMLTKRQMQVLMLMTCTSTNREIAERLVISEETVRSHVKGILRKLGQTNRTQAVLEAVRIGLIKI